MSAETKRWRLKLNLAGFAFCRKLSPLLFDIFVECLGGKAKACSLGLWISESGFVGRAGWEISAVSLS